MIFVCPCGETHEVDETMWAWYYRVTAGQPATVPIETPDGRWDVPRLYLVKHQITGQTLAALAAQYGWPSVER